MLEEERKRILTKQKQRMKELQKLLATRVKAYDSHQGLAQMSKSRVNHLRYHGTVPTLNHWLPGSVLFLPCLFFSFFSPFFSFLLFNQ